ncbi:MAG: tRNA uridine-5-carboxymethylaminomethyl(34) synthesis GTPase MnmE [Thermincola sp.]|nr:tRNA uridine-5-carboxymethylaminomethyl(34) synthesis GTPase MnmE [Thermincola sp.]MDT3701949.1 tRNA uridine-5-carboxymethylaminomethyl(34) synthesis GTPase MnmE [Thermincola sp.]
MFEDTIAAIATPIGAAGIGIVRISGKDALTIAEKVFQSKNKKRLLEIRHYTMIYGHIIDKNKGIVDEVLVSVMLGPHSFTAENVIEINCHGGVVAVRKILEVVLDAGARLAEPGEFSKRAFLNGRIDLAQAESIIDLINAKTDKSLQVAINQLEGKLSGQIKLINGELLGLIAQIEAGIDFPEHDIEKLSRAQIANKTEELLQQINRMIDSADTGRVFREGLKTVIIGKPNVGKSSLLNALLKEKRAIVTDIPGTTRDVIEVIINIKGIPLKLVDTAGIRETDDIVEKIGVEKTKEASEEADLILLMIDASTGITENDLQLLPLIKGKKSLIIFNKIDLKENFAFPDSTQFLGEYEFVETSLVNGQGLLQLENKIENLVYTGMVISHNDLMVTNVRHKNSLVRAAESLTNTLSAIQGQLPTDCFAIDLKSAWEALGEITGETVGEDLVDQIFSRFCIGK